MQLPRRAVPDAFDDDYREWDEEKEPQETEEDMSHLVQALAVHLMSVSRAQCWHKP